MTQGEAVLRHGVEQYGSEPEHLWARNPGYAVLRRQDDRKWYAALLDVPRKRLGLPGNGTVEILDVKCEPRMLGSLLGTPGYLPAYHMSKSGWITVLLDGTVPTEEILALLDMSYDLAAKRKKTN